VSYSLAEFVPSALTLISCPSILVNPIDYFCAEGPDNQRATGVRIIGRERLDVLTRPPTPPTAARAASRKSSIIGQRNLGFPPTSIYFSCVSCRRAGYIHPGIIVAAGSVRRFGPRQCCAPPGIDKRRNFRVADCGIPCHLLLPHRAIRVTFPIRLRRNFAGMLFGGKEMASATAPTASEGDVPRASMNPRIKSARLIVPKLPPDLLTGAPKSFRCS
jgi:hypothetical protein